MSKPYRTLFRILLPLLIVAALVLVVRHRRAALSQAPRDAVGPLPVRVATTRAGSLDLTRDYIAVVESQRTTEIASRLTARVVSVAVREGDVVAAGTVLAILQSDDLQAALVSAKAQTGAAESEIAAHQATLGALRQSCAFLEREWERMRKLLEGDAATEQQLDATRERLDDVQGRLAAAAARLEALRQALTAAQARQRDAELRIAQDASLVCENDGIVTARRVEPGDMATPGRTLLVLASPALRLAFDVPQSNLSDAVPGASLRWTSPAPGGKACITRVHPALSASRMRRAEADLDAGAPPSLAIGAYVPVQLQTGRLDAATLVPSAALVESPATGTYVFVVDADSILRPVAVERLGRQEDDIAVRGLEAGATVVVNTYLGWTALSSGRAVEILP